MVKKMLLAGVLGISLISFVGNQAWAAVTCPVDCTRKLGRTIYCTDPCVTAGGVWTTLLGYGLGNVFKEGNDVFLGIQVNTDAGTDFAVVCSNNGGNVAPGAVPIPSSAPHSTADFTIVDSTLATKNGRVEVTVHATPDELLLADLELYAETNNLGTCPNDLWYLSDAVPCQMTLNLIQRELFNEGTQTCVTADAVYDCTLTDDTDTLPPIESCSVEIEPSTKELVAKGFVCREIDSNTYQNGTHDCQDI